MNALCRMLTADRGVKREFSPGELIEGLTAAQERQLINSGYALQAQNDEEKQSLTAQLARSNSQDLWIGASRDLLMPW